MTENNLKLEFEIDYKTHSITAIHKYTPDHGILGVGKTLQEATDDLINNLIKYNRLEDD